MALSAKRSKVSISLPHGNERFRELIVYIATKCVDDETFGAIKINKILWRADFLSYKTRGVPITGAEYMRLDHGPAPRKMIPVKRELMKEGAVKELEFMYHGKKQKRLLAKRPPDLSMFTGEDIAFVDGVIDEMWGKNAVFCSRLSHDHAWEIAAPRESIPYQAAFLSDVPPTDSDIRWANSMIRQHGWHG